MFLLAQAHLDCFPWSKRKVICCPSSCSVPQLAGKEGSPKKLCSSSSTWFPLKIKPGYGKKVEGWSSTHPGKVQGPLPMPWFRQRHYVLQARFWSSQCHFWTRGSYTTWRPCSILQFDVLVHIFPGVLFPTKKLKKEKSSARALVIKLVTFFPWLKFCQYVSNFTTGS